jgi:hypothetical protein
VSWQIHEFHFPGDDVHLVGGEAEEDQIVDVVAVAIYGGGTGGDTTG